MSFVRLCLKDVDTGYLILETSWTLFEKVARPALGAHVGQVSAWIGYVNSLELLTYRSRSEDARHPPQPEGRLPLSVPFCAFGSNPMLKHRMSTEKRENSTEIGRRADHDTFSNRV